MIQYCDNASFFLHQQSIINILIKILHLHELSLWWTRGKDRITHLLAQSRSSTPEVKNTARGSYIFFQIIMTHCIRLFLPTDCFCNYLLKILKCNNALSESGNSKYVMNTGYMRVLKKGGGVYAWTPRLPGNF